MIIATESHPQHNSEKNAYIDNPPVRTSTREYTSELEPFKETIINKVDMYGSTAMAIYKFIQKRGFKGKYGIVAKFVREHKDSSQKKATIRFETSPGLQAQVDWKENLQVSVSGFPFVKTLDDFGKEFNHHHCKSAIFKVGGCILRRSTCQCNT